MAENSDNWVGKAVPRLEDEALLSGNARFIDDLSPLPGLRHAAILRSPYPHAMIRSIDISAAIALPGVCGGGTGREIAEIIDPLVSAVRAPIKYYPIAIERVRYGGEPVAIIAAENRYIAEDAMELIEVNYDPLPAISEPLAALEKTSPTLHEAVGSNLVHNRKFAYGNPDRAFEEATHTIKLDWR